MRPLKVAVALVLAAAAIAGCGSEDGLDQASNKI